MTEFERGFVTGFLAGDGCVDSNGSGVRIRFTQDTKPVLARIRQILENNKVVRVGRKVYELQGKLNHYYSLEYTGQDAKNICDWIGVTYIAFKDLRIFKSLEGSEIEYPQVEMI